MKVLFPYSVVNYSSLPWMIAKDAGLFRKQDLDVDLVFMGSSALIIQSMLSGAVPLAGVAGPAVISSAVGGGDVVTIANLAPLTIALMVKPTIEKPEDLRGKKIGVPRLGAVAHFAIRMILDRHGIKDAVIRTEILSSDRSNSKSELLVVTTVAPWRRAVSAINASF